MTVERSRERDLEDPWYDDECDEFERQRIRAETGTIVIRGDDLPWYQNRQANRVKYYLTPQKTDTALQTMEVFLREDYEFSGMHRHQGGVVIYALEGKGYTVVDGERHEWEGGDLVLLPVKPGGVAHQHFNHNPRAGSRWLAFIVNAFRDHLANEMVQLVDSPTWRGSKTQGREQPALKGQNDTPIPDPPPQGGGRSLGAAELSTATRNGDQETVFGRLMALRDAFRLRADSGVAVIKGNDLPWEINPHGKMKWLLHPFQDDAVLKSHLVYVQDIPPGSRSGKQLSPGGTVQFVMSGRGYSVINGVREDWKAGDCIALPIRPSAITFQHFNEDRRQPVHLISVTPNLVDVFGPDMSSEFDQLENAPEYEEQVRS